MTRRERENAIKRFERSLLRVWQAADAPARQYGAAWYSEAHAAAASLADRYGFTVEQAAGVIAALSPRIHWGENLADAETVLSWAENERDGYGHDVPYWALPVSAFSTNVAKACEVLAVDNPLTVLNGPKQRAFYSSIIGDTSTVTVDVWATRAATYGKLDTPKRLYDLIAAAYKRAARKVGTTPRDFQAAVWVTLRSNPSLFK